MDKKSGKKRMLAIMIGFMAFVAAGIWLYSHRTIDIEPILSSGGADIDLPPPAGGAYYLQADPRWSSDMIGGSGESLSSVGCTICAVAMATSYLGYEITPKDLNTRLIHYGGYTSRGWIIWNKITAATEGDIAVRVPSRLAHSDIDEALRSGGFPVIKFFLPGGIPHWVTVVGKSGREYLIKDSLDSKLKIAKLSEKTEAIISVRYVEKR